MRRTLKLAAYGGFCCLFGMGVTALAQWTVEADSQIHVLSKQLNIIIADMVTIHPDGSMEFADDYKPDEVSRAFWRALGEGRPKCDQ